MSREFTKVEQHRVTKLLFSGLVSIVGTILQTVKRNSEIRGITFSWYGPRADVQQEPSIAVMTDDRIIVVRGTTGRRLVAYSEKNVGRRSPGPTPRTERDQGTKT